MVFVTVLINMWCQCVCGLLTLCGFVGKQYLVKAKAVVRVVVTTNSHEYGKRCIPGMSSL